MFDRNEALDRYRHWYNRTIAAGGDSFEKFDYHLRNQLGALSLAGKRVLEVGCGKGAVSLYLALFSGASEVVAVDEAAGKGSPVGVTEAVKEAVRAFGVSNLCVLDIDIMQNHFEDCHFDTLVQISFFGSNILARV